MSDKEVTDSMNTVDRTVNRNTMSATEVFNIIVVVDFLALADGDRSTILAILGFGEVNPFGKEADVFISIFGAGSDTIVALASARLRPVSRAIELGLPKVKVGHVATARIV